MGGREDAGKRAGRDRVASQKERKQSEHYRVKVINPQDKKSLTKMGSTALLRASW